MRKVHICTGTFRALNKETTSDGFELEIGEPSRAEPSWIFPSRAELADFKMRAEPSWRTLKCELAELNIFRDEVNSS